MNTVTGGPAGRPAHGDRPGLPWRMLVGALAAAVVGAGVLAALIGHAGSVPSEPGSALRITVSSRPPTLASIDPP